MHKVSHLVKFVQRKDKLSAIVIIGVARTRLKITFDGFSNSSFEFRVILLLG